MAGSFKRELLNAFKRFRGQFPGIDFLDSSGGATGPTVDFGTGTPEAAVTAIVGSLYLRLDGGASTTLYVKTSGTGNTGWTAK